MTAHSFALGQPLAERIRLRDPAMSLRIVAPADMSFQLQLNAEERGAAYAGLGLPDALVEKLLAAHLKAQSDDFRAQYPRAEHLIVSRHGEAIGRLSLTLEVNDFGLCLRLIDILLVQEQRGQGFGRDILCGIIDSARAMRLTRVNLSVFAANERAIRLFKKVGFRLQGGADESLNFAMIYPLP
jgi:RimJ/RimL family protein N-acetyltransferase